MKVLILDNGQNLRFRCPGCAQNHTVGIGSKLPTWSYNGDQHNPTLLPSILARGVREDIDELSDELQEEFERLSRLPNGHDLVLGDKRFHTVCHSYVTAGKIKFLDDCTHSLANQTVELPDIT